MSKLCWTGAWSMWRLKAGYCDILRGMLSEVLSLISQSWVQPESMTCLLLQGKIGLDCCRRKECFHLFTYESFYHTFSHIPSVTSTVRLSLPLPNPLSLSLSPYLLSIFLCFLMFHRMSLGVTTPKMRHWKSSVCVSVLKHLKWEPHVCVSEPGLMKSSPLFISRGPVTWPVVAPAHTHTPSVYNVHSHLYCRRPKSLEWSLDGRMRT